MDWIFKTRKVTEPDEVKLKKIIESLSKKQEVIKELLKFSKRNLTLASEEELEFLEAHPDYERNGIFESQEYHTYCIRNATESLKWELLKLDELKKPKEMIEGLLKVKKNE